MSFASKRPESRPDAAATTSTRRILVAPDQLRTIAAEFDQVVEALKESAGSTARALKPLVWDVPENAMLRAHIEQTRERAESALALATELARSLRSVVERFEAVDRISALSLEAPIQEMRRASKGTTWGPGSVSALSGSGIEAAIGLGFLLCNRLFELEAAMEVAVVAIPVGVVRQGVSAANDVIDRDAMGASKESAFDVFGWSEHDAHLG